jgi:hypothetical protein
MCLSHYPYRLRFLAVPRDRYPMLRALASPGIASTPERLHVPDAQLTRTGRSSAQDPHRRALRITDITTSRGRSTDFGLPSSPAPSLSSIFVPCAPCAPWPHSHRHRSTRARRFGACPHLHRRSQDGYIPAFPLLFVTSPHIATAFCSAPPLGFPDYPRLKRPRRPMAIFRAR